MITTLAPLLMDSTLASAPSVTYMAAPIWDIGSNIKNQGITTAVYVLMGGTALVAAFSFLVAKNKTAALKTLGAGVVLVGLVGALPALGVVAKDTTKGIVNTGGTR